MRIAKLVFIVFFLSVPATAQEAAVASDVEDDPKVDVTLLAGTDYISGRLDVRDYETVAISGGISARSGQFFLSAAVPYVITTAPEDLIVSNGGVLGTPLLSQPAVQSRQVTREGIGDLVFRGGYLFSLASVDASIANVQLIGTDAVTGAARAMASTVRNAATSTVGSARERATGAAGQVSSVAGSANGAAAGAGMFNSGILALAGSGAAQGEGAFAVAPGMPVQLPSGEQLGTVRDVVATRSGEVRQLVVETENGLASISAGSLTTSGSLLIAGQSSGSATNQAPAEASGAK